MPFLLLFLLFVLEMLEIRVIHCVKDYFKCKSKNKDSVHVYIMVPEGKMSVPVLCPDHGFVSITFFYRMLQRG